MDYKQVYNEDYFSGKTSFFYKLGYGKFSTLYFRNLYKPLKKYIANIQHGKVLDVGCAYGYMLANFPSNFEKSGIDVSAHAIAEAKKRLPQANLVVGGAEDPFPFEPNSFDVVISNDVLEHLTNPGNALKNIYRVLKKGGIFYINCPNPNLFRRVLLRKADEKEHHISMKPHAELKKLLQNNGFQIVDDWTFSADLHLFFPRFKSNFGIEQAFVCKK